MAAYMVLRRNSQIIIQLSRALFKDLFPNAQVEEEMLHAFYLDRTEDAALHRIDQLIESGTRPPFLRVMLTAKAWARGSASSRR